MSVSRILCCLFAVGLGLAGPAGAEGLDGGPADPPEARAARLMAAERYLEAVNELESAYAVRQSPALLYQLGRAHQRLGHVAQARDYYQRYLASGAADPALRADAEEQLRQIFRVPGMAPAPAVVAPGLSSDLRLVPVRMERRPNRPLLNAGISLLTIGYTGAFVTGATLAGIFGGSSSSSEQPYTVASGLLLIPVVGPIISSIYLPSTPRNSETSLYWSLPWMFTSAGMQVSGLIMTIIGAKDRQDVPVIVPYSMPGGGGLSLAGRF